MGRPAAFKREDIVSAVLELVSEGGPRAATISAISKRVGAPTGSIYHRFRSRELLLAELWLDVVEEFQGALIAKLGEPDPVQAALQAALFMPAWVRDHPREAKLLLLHHRRDFVAGDWPEELVQRGSSLEPAMAAAVRELAIRLYGAAGEDEMRRVRFALLDIPYASLRPYVREGRPPPRQLDVLIRQACVPVLRGEPDAEQ